VSSLVNDLVDEGVVVELESTGASAGASGGRPPTMVALDHRAGCAIGVDIGKTHLTVAVADAGHKILAERRAGLPEDHQAADDLGVAIELIEAVLEDSGVERAQVLGVGMGLPGPIHQVTGTVGSSAILPGWVGVRAAQELSDRLGLPVRVDNDANLGSLAESVWGAGREARDMIYLKLATGIGAGFVLDGRLYAGIGGTAGEVGHMIVDENGPVCRCANRGCLETLASGAACVELLKPTFGDGLTLPRLVELCSDGAPAAQRVVADAGRLIGLALATIVNVLNPSLVVIGGEMAACGDVLLDPLRRECLRHAIRSAAEDVTLIASPLGDRAEVLGALALILLDAGQVAGEPPVPITHSRGGAR
jgi:predicted NBD/HSP70 family sugar kinase